MTQSSDNDTDEPEVAETGPDKARIRRTPWRGWLMAVPLAALILVGYLVIRTWLVTGPTATVTFPRSAGISAQSTVVKYKGIKVGQVTELKLVDDLHKVRATLQMKSSVADALNTGTVFWIVSPSILSGNIKSLLGGPYIAMQPGSGSPKHQFRGRLHPPRTPANVSGRIVTLYATEQGSLGRGSLVLYHDVRAGRILTVDFEAKKDRVKFRALLKEPFAKKLDADSRFWRAGGFGIHTGSGGIEIQVPNPKILLAGAIAFGDVHPAKQKPAKKEPAATQSDQRASFLLYDGKGAARSGLAGPSRRFSLDPPGATPDIQIGAPVTLKGQQIGRVSQVWMRYDPDSERIKTDLEITIYAQALGISRHAGSNTKNNAPSRLVNAIGNLVADGLRARFTTSIPVIGGTHIALVMTDQDEIEGIDRTAVPPAIPMVGSGGTGGLIAEVGAIVDELNAIPLAEIGHNVEQTTANIREITASPKIESALSRLNSVLAHLDDITASTEGQIKPTLKSLREAAAAAESALEQIRTLTGGRATNQANLQHLIEELTGAARSIRVLTSYLRRHPEALIYGQGN